MKAELSFIKQKFKENYKQFQKHHNASEKVDDFTIVWSDSFLDFFPYESALEGHASPILYQEQPENKENIIRNKIKDGELYYACYHYNEEWGAVFYFHDGHNKMRLHFDDQNEDDKMLLDQITYVVFEGSVVKKALYYMNDKDVDEESFYVYEFFYDTEQKMSKIIRTDFFNDKNVITYHFEHTDRKCTVRQEWYDAKGVLKQKQLRIKQCK